MRFSLSIQYQVLMCRSRGGVAPWPGLTMQGKVSRLRRFAKVDRKDWLGWSGSRS